MSAIVILLELHRRLIDICEREVSAGGKGEDKQRYELCDACTQKTINSCVYTQCTQ